MLQEHSCENPDDSGFEIQKGSSYRFGTCEMQKAMAKPHRLLEGRFVGLAAPFRPNYLRYSLGFSQGTRLPPAVFVGGAVRSLGRVMRPRPQLKLPKPHKQRYSLNSLNSVRTFQDIQAALMHRAGKHIPWTSSLFAAGLLESTSLKT